jgi:hypothetical protein
MRTHDALPALRSESIEGLQEGLAAEIGAKGIEVTVARKSREGGCD